MKHIAKTILLSLTASVTLMACDVSISSGGIEDMDAPKVIPDLAPLPNARLAYAESIVREFYAGNDQALLAGVDDTVKAEITSEALTGLHRLKTDAASIEEMEYYGHGFGEERGMSLTIVQFRLPTNSGYDLVRIAMKAEQECCELAGLHVERKIIKTLFGD
jgi:hypothetical protein